MPFAASDVHRINWLTTVATLAEAFPARGDATDPVVWHALRRCYCRVTPIDGETTEPYSTELLTVSRAGIEFTSWRSFKQGERLRVEFLGEKPDDADDAQPGPQWTLHVAWCQRRDASPNRYRVAATVANAQNTASMPSARIGSPGN